MRPPAVPAWVLCCLVLFAPVSTAHDAESLLKAGFISKFPGFVTWPAPDRSDRQAPFRFCVFGPSGLTEELEKLLPFTPINGSPPGLRTIEAASDASSCELVFLPARQLGEPSRSVREKVGDRPVLLVSEGADALDHGVHIGLVRVGERLRFDIDRAAFEHSGLRVSFRLLEMARTVR
jgi:hypothetical protein